MNVQFVLFIIILCIFEHFYELLALVNFSSFENALMGTVMMLSNVIHHTLLSAKKSSTDVLLILLERFSTQVVFLGTWILLWCLIRSYRRDVVLKHQRKKPFRKWRMRYNSNLYVILKCHYIVHWEHLKRFLRLWMKLWCVLRLYLLEKYFLHMAQ